MKEHEWVVETVEGGPLGDFTVRHCINCGGKAIDGLFYKEGAKPKRIKIPFTNVYLTEDCEHSAKVVQEYWEKEGKKKYVYKK